MTDDTCVLHEIPKEMRVCCAEDTPSLSCVTPYAPEKQRFQAKGSSPGDLVHEQARVCSSLPPPHTSDIL